MNQITALPGIHAALGERSVITLEAMQAELDCGAAQLCEFDGSAIFVRRIEYPDAHEVVLEAGPAGGNKQEILEAVPRIEAWAKEIGCTQVHVHAGREGWAPLLKAQGYEVYQIILRKVLV